MGHVVTIERARVLLVDDEPNVLHGIVRTLSSELGDQLDIVLAGNGREALEKMQMVPADVVVTDIAMPVMDGEQLIKCLNDLFPKTSLIVLSGHWGQADAFDRLGPNVAYLTKPVGKDLLVWTVRRAIAQARSHQQAKTSVGERSRIEAAIRSAHKVALIVLADLAEHRDRATGGHVLRVARMAHEIARELYRKAVERETCDVTFTQHIGVSSILHDVGKVSIPDAILLKPGPLDDDERRIMQTHASTGGALLQKGQWMLGGSTYFKLAAEIADGHHECWNGSGYPNRLAGRDIPLAARITAVADVYDALMSKRPYKEAWEVDQVLSYMRDQRGTQFDPVIVDAFFAVLSSRSKAPQIEWNASIEIGHTIVDRDHRVLLELINQLINKDNVEDRIVVEFVLDELISYIRYHFKNEEDLMEQCNYPDLEDHKLIHSHMISEVNDLHRRFLSDDETIGDELSQFLQMWLMNHIIIEDKKFRPFILL